ncbi:MAG TPA: NAD(P)/FAD-dependent oxidoreductase [Solirubrobacteraceae bacterium]
MNEIAAQLGEVGLPAPMSELAARDWDAVVVGGGHNGLTAAAYLAYAGASVLVLERRERLGGACTLERPFQDQRFVVSPCAYVVGLLDELVISELDLRRRGFECWAADPNLWVPFDDGTAFAQWLDHDRTQRGLEDLGVSAKDIEGYWAYEELFDAIRRKLRTGSRDSWVGESPTRPEIEELLEGDQTMIDVVFDASIAEVLDDHMSDQRLKDALFGQAVIAAYGGPKDKGTASIKLMHYQGDLEGQGPVWGYVKGGMGMISFALADAAREAGALLACGVSVGAIVPEEGVVLEDGTRIRARTVLCNADPKVALRLLEGQDVPADYRARLEAWKIRSPVVKFNAALTDLPEWTAAPGESWPARATIDVTGGLEDAQRAFEACDRGEPAVGFGEVYLQTGYDPSPAPAGHHLLSVFGQYAPYELAEGTWDSRREEVARQFIDLIDRFAPGFEDRVVAYEVLGPPDIEDRIGLTGGNIFQGEVTPDQMWEHRLAPRTPVPGLYFCGAATHPGGSVIALNGRNAARAVLADTREMAAR